MGFMLMTYENERSFPIHVSKKHKSLVGYSVDSVIMKQQKENLSTFSTFSSLNKSYQYKFSARQCTVF